MTVTDALVRMRDGAIVGGLIGGPMGGVTAIANNRTPLEASQDQIIQASQEAAEAGGDVLGSSDCRWASSVYYISCSCR